MSTYNDNKTEHLHKIINMEPTAKVGTIQAEVSIEIMCVAKNAALQVILTDFMESAK